MPEAIYLLTILALILQGRDRTDRKAMLEIAVDQLRLFLGAAALISLLWTAEIYIPSVLFYRVFILLNLSYFYFRGTAQPFVHFPVGFTLSYIGVGFFSVAALWKVLVLVSLLSLLIGLFRLAFTGIDERLGWGLKSKAKLWAARLIFIGIWLETGTLWGRLFPVLQMFDWNLPIRQLLS